MIQIVQESVAAPRVSGAVHPSRRKSRAQRWLAVIGALAALAAAHPAWACASCGCTLNADFDSQGLETHAGVLLDLRFDYLDQNQLRSGTGTTSPAQVAANGWENELYTINRYLTLGVDYAVNADWGVGVQLPYIDRKHGTLGVSADGVTPQPDGAYVSHTDALGDAKVLGRYQGLLPSGNLGLQFGLKLPTGAHDKNGTFVSDGTQAAIDPGLQPGTGTTDLILGAFYHDALSRDWDYFAQALGQAALGQRGPDGASYRPGNSVNLTLGMRYAGWDVIAPQLQLNYRRVNADGGDIADRVSTGGTLLHLTPGVVATVNHRTAVYGFVQVPVHQRLNGAQLAVRYLLSTGVKFSL